MILNLSQNELKNLQEKLQNEYNSYKDKNLKLDMSRGKPGKEQLDLSEKMLTVISKNEDCFDAAGNDCRNYGLLDGIAEAKKMFADIFDCNISEVIVGGNSSLNMMYDLVVKALLLGVANGEKAWGKYEKIKFLCPSPGYDRHFAICQSLNIEMITIPMLKNGPDMDLIEKLVKNDETIKGMWCVPKYSNPEGKTYSDDVVKRLAGLKTAAKDFRIFWDNAYMLHDIGNESDKLLNILDEAKKAGNPDIVYMFTSTSKISYPGAGVGALASSENNINLIKKQMFFQTIGPDKLNQLRHVKYFKDANGIKDYMQKHKNILQPRFQAVIDTLSKGLGSENIAEWNIPRGGYFLSLDVQPNCAKRVVEMLKNAGVVMTSAGATFPYGVDPEDKNIRIAPTLPPVSELVVAMELLCICVKLATVEKLLK